MGTAVNKTDFTVYRSINTPDFPPASWVRNSPNLDTLVGTGTDVDPQVPKRYWIVDPPASQNLREMTAPEKAVADTDSGVVALTKSLRKAELLNETESFIASRYSASTRATFSELKSSVTGDQLLLLNTYYAWYSSVYGEHNNVVALINAATDVPTILGYSVNYTPFGTSDPGVTVDAVLAATPGYAIGTGPSVFDSSVSTTTSSSFIDRVALVNEMISGGTYRFTVAYGWNVDSTTQDIEVQVLEDSGSGYAVIMQIHKQEVSEAGGTFGVTGTDQRYYTTRIFERTLSSGTYSWKIQYRAESSYAVSLWEVLLKVDLVS